MTLTIEIEIANTPSLDGLADLLKSVEAMRNSAEMPFTLQEEGWEADDESNIIVKWSAEQ